MAVYHGRRQPKAPPGELFAATLQDGTTAMEGGLVAPYRRDPTPPAFGPYRKHVLNNATADFLPKHRYKKDGEK